MERHNPMTPKSRSSRQSSIYGRDMRPRVSAVNTVLKTPLHIVERYGMPVPVLIEEAFAFSDRNAIITAKISDCGYAWVVCGRKLLMWQFQLSYLGNSPKQRKFPICYELRLPQSDLAHRAELVAVFFNRNAVHPSCVAVSPEGMVRYWSDVTQDHCSVDKHVDLNGQECDSLIYIGVMGCVFVTTTCTVVLVQHKQGYYGPEIHCKTLKTSSSWLGGISRRVSSIFFGPMSADQGNETRIIRLLSVPGIQQIVAVYVLAGLTFQKWLLSDQETEQLIWTTDLSRSIRDAFRLNVNHWDGSDYMDVDIWILDIQTDRDGVLMLCAAVNLHMSPQVYYAMASLSTQGANPPTQLKDFLLLNLMSLYNDDNPGDALSWRFIMSGSNAYVYGPKVITVIKPQEEVDTLAFHNANDHLFNGATCSGHPIFFSKQHGLVTISTTGVDMSLSLTPHTSILETSLHDQSLATNNLSVYHMNPHEMYTAHRDTAGQLKAAFIFHVKNELTECYDVVNKLFPSDIPLVPGFDGPLDTAVVKIGCDILDDIPAGDPRWTHGERSRQGVGSSHSMLVMHQLVDKQKAFTLFLNFLKESGLWDKLAGITVKDNQMTTIHRLAEFAEKNTAAIVMKGLPITYMFETTLGSVVKHYNTETGSNLSNQDIFFREVSRIHEGINCLSKICEDIAHSGSGPMNVSAAIQEANSIILSVLTEVLQYRKQQKVFFNLTDVANSLKLEYLPWTAAAGSEGLADSLMLQHSLTINYGLKLTTQAQEDLRAQLIDNFVLLTDVILDGRKNHLASVAPGGREKVLYKQYCSDRHKLIKPLVEEKAYERAAMLAEKYLDFEILMTVCERIDSEDRLNEYMRRFKDTGFPEFVYSWHLKHGKPAKLIDRYRRVGGQVPEGQNRLSKFLVSYPEIGWIQQIFDKDFSAAAETLKILGEKESERVTKQKTAFSLSKLAKLAAPNSEDTNKHLDEINKRLELIAYQEQVPDYVLQQYGFDAINPRVLHPKDLIALYTCTEYTDATEVDFRKALDVAKYISDEYEKIELVLQIWRAALLRDTWEFPNLDSPLECLQATLFFKIVDLSIVLGADPTNLLPPLDMLIDDTSLNDLNDNKNFQSLLKMGYEHFHRTQLL
ncbi:nuclear pore complex protein Nup133 [Sitophilus oryzae]|uniref:Nuclear pore complex protein Nup133 n=1 Tax=Sitophilus oryzae TaxID=7048 RepID=A0A6J2XB75_SITOR|nr:nuclear pore complex protein Nup133 [Sitophilus oryzae]